jgi:hypothetical protein
MGVIKGEKDLKAVMELFVDDNGMIHLSGLTNIFYHLGTFSYNNEKRKYFQSRTLS